MLRNKIVLIILLLLNLVPVGIVLAMDKIVLVTSKQKEIVIDSSELSGWIDVKPFLKYRIGYSAEIENINYCPVNSILCELTKTQLKRQEVEKISTQTIKKNKIKLFFNLLADKINIPPENAIFSATETGKIATFSLGKNGKSLNVDKNVEQIIKTLKKNKENNDEEYIQLIYNIIEPEIKASSAEKLGIKTLIGKGQSRFYGSTASRMHNIKTATARFHGLLINPGEEFSFVQNLGEVDGEHGYKEELVIKNKETKPEFGGGICQVSTTIFRAAIYSGLKIIERHNHAYPVHYYDPQGMDATIYIPNPDLRFLNNTNGHILIQAKVDIPTRTLTFEFYGADDGRKIEIDGPHITSRQSDGSMKAFFTQKVYRADKSLLIDDIFKSDYKSPSLYPHPGQETTLTKKPKKWSDREWKKYKKEHNI